MVTPVLIAASNGVIVKSSTVVIAIFLMRCHPLFLLFPLIELHGCCGLLDLNSRGRRR